MGRQTWGEGVHVGATTPSGGRLAATFARARAEDRAALVIYLCAGDPSLADTPRLVRAAAEAGADIVELGMPFSDPTADGPAIQRASERALSAGATLPGVLGALRELRAGGCDVRVVRFGYYIPILAYGEAELARDAAAAGVDGLLVVDLPPEEAAPLREPATAAGLDLVPLVAPTTGIERARAVAAEATGFVYAVSMTGVTGSAAGDLAEAGARASELAEASGRPVAVGFGVKTPEDAAAVAAQADGVVVGSALVRRVEAAGADVDAAEASVRELVGALSKACQRPATP